MDGVIREVVVEAEARGAPFCGVILVARLLERQLADFGNQVALFLCREELPLIEESRRSGAGFKKLALLGQLNAWIPAKR